MKDISLHDGHSSHYEDVTPQARPVQNNYQRSIELNQYTPVDTARVHYTFASAASQERIPRY